MLFEALELREVVLRNRIVVSPMCQYSSEDGFANDWHFVHLGSRAVGGAALVLTEAPTATCCTNSFRRCRTGEATRTAARSKTGSVRCWR